MNFLILLAILLLTSGSFVISESNEDTTQPEKTTEDQETNVTSKTDSSEKDSKSIPEDPKDSSKIPKKKYESQKPQKNSVESETESCNPWPSTLRPLRECCILPHNSMSVTLNTCFYRCTSHDGNEKSQLECGASCFVNLTGIYVNNHFYKDRIKTLMITASGVPAKWIRVIENAIDGCKLEDRSSLHDQLARFFGCVNDFMNDNCVNFVQSRECDATQEHFEQCHKIKQPCEHWPFGYGTLENCCKIPTLFSQDLRTKCHHECTYSELFLQRQAKCDEVCRYDSTKLRIDNKFNFDAVRAMLMQSARNDPIWKSPIDHAVEKCKSILGVGRNIRASKIDYEITTLQTCLREFLASECAEFKDELICRKVKIFMKNCPDLRPRKTTQQQSQQYGRA